MPCPQLLSGACGLASGRKVLLGLHLSLFSRLKLCFCVYEQNQSLCKSNSARWTPATLSVLPLRQRVFLNPEPFFFRLKDYSVLRRCLLFDFYHVCWCQIYLLCWTWNRSGISLNCLRNPILTERPFSFILASNVYLKKEVAMVVWQLPLSFPPTKS